MTRPKSRLTVAVKVEVAEITRSLAALLTTEGLIVLATAMSLEIERTSPTENADDAGMVRMSDLTLANVAVTVDVAATARENPLIAVMPTVMVDATAIARLRAAAFTTTGENVEATAMILEIPRETKTPNAEVTAIVRILAPIPASDGANVEVAAMMIGKFVALALDNSSSNHASGDSSESNHQLITTPLAVALRNRDCNQRAGPTALRRRSLRHRWLSRVLRHLLTAKAKADRTACERRCCRRR